MGVNNWNHELSVFMAMRSKPDCQYYLNGNRITESELAGSFI